MMSRVGGRGTLGRHLIHYILHRPFYKRALCWSGAGALGGDSSPHNSWKDRWMETGLDQWRKRDGTGTTTVVGIQPIHSNVNFIIFIVNSTISSQQKALFSDLFHLSNYKGSNRSSRKVTILQDFTVSSLSYCVLFHSRSLFSSKTIK